jgi:hypothetical protein
VFIGVFGVDAYIPLKTLFFVAVGCFAAFFAGLWLWLQAGGASLIKER